MKIEMLDPQSSKPLVRFTGRPEEVAVAAALYGMLIQASAGDEMDVSAMMGKLERELMEFLSRDEA